MIKRHIKKWMFGASIFLGLNANSQTISSFDSLSLDSSGYWVGTTMGDYFVDGKATFTCDYDTNWGGFWSGGFGYTNHIDSVTPGYSGWTATNPYSTFAGVSYSGDQFSVVNAFASANVKLDSAYIVQGFFVSNSTFAAISMRDGDGIGKVFGSDTLADGSTTNYLGYPVTGEDWFKLTITPSYGGTIFLSKSIDFYLADYRFADDARDYILEGWNWVDLTSFGEVDGLSFTLSSTDVGAFGMNTPAFFCMDDLTIGEITQGLNYGYENLISIYPNPATDRVNLKVPSTNFVVTILDNVGRVVLNSNKNNIDVSGLNAGMYIISIDIDGEVVQEKLIIK